MKNNFFIIFLVTILLGSCSSEKIQISAYYDTETGKVEYEGKSFLLVAHSEGPLSEGEFWFNVFAAFGLTLFAGAMSGLTVGYLSIDDLVMELKQTTGTEEEKNYAKKILPVIHNHHWLLVTLLLCNAFAMEALPIVLDKLLNEIMAIVVSVTLILFFGEIIPQAILTGPNQLKFASAFAPMTTFLMYATYPISYPLGILIDNVVGKHLKSRFCNTDLKGLIELHTKEAIEKIKEEEKEDNKMADDFGISKEQAKIMKGTIDIQEKKVKDIMISVNKATMIEYDSPLDNDTIKDLLNKGFSRIPVYLGEKDNVLGILRMKTLIGIDLKNKSLKEMNFNLSKPIIVSPEMPAMDLLDEFRKGRSHMAFVTKEVENLQKRLGLNRENSFSESLLANKIGGQNLPTGKLIGIITLEDVIEKMININILDEEDYKKKKALTKKESKENIRKFKKALTRKICESFIEEKKGQINSLIGNSMGGRLDLNENHPNDYNSPEDCYLLLKNN